MNYWWVNQKKTHAQEQSGGYLWSPKTKKDGSSNPFYNSMTQVAPGDVIVCYWEKAVRAVGIARSTARSSERPPEFGDVGAVWANVGWRVPCEFIPAERPFFPTDYPDEIRPLLPDRFSPLRSVNLLGKEFYLTSISEILGELILSRIGNAQDIRLIADDDREIGDAPEVSAAIDAIAEVAGKPRGQGFGLSAPKRKAVDEYAMAKVQKHFEARGYHVADVHRTRSYDFVCTKDGIEKHVEVKGTTGLGKRVLLTKNEVAHARLYERVVLAIVSEILLEDGDPPIASGGQERIHDPWIINEGCLTALSFEYSVRPIEGTKGS